MVDVAVIDYGVGNLLSVSRALAHCGANVVVTSDPVTILGSNRVVLPGVGAFANGMQALSEHRLDDVVRDFAASGKPLLGICLGMQMLLDASEEFGYTNGLGLVPGRVIGLPQIDTEGCQLKVPHIGWNALNPTHGYNTWEHTVLSDTQEGEAMYFVHSFAAQLQDNRHLLAECVHGGHRICAVVQKANVTGFQFHPEKSGNSGLILLNRFLRS
jgi:glutamine amidotransferase